MKIYVILAVLLLATTLFTSCFAGGKNRKLLFAHKGGPWKIWYVTENNFPAGKAHYYEVFYRDRQLVFPQELTGGTRHVSRLIAASGYESGETNAGSVLVVFEGHKRKENGFEERTTMTVLVTPGIKENELTVTDLCSGQSAIISPPDE